MEEKEEKIILDGKQVTIKTFIGVYNRTMPLLRKEGFRPATLEEIIKIIIEKNFLEEKTSTDFYDSVTGILYAPNGSKFKIVPSLENLKNINEKTKLYIDRIIKSEEEYKNIKAEEFTKEFTMKDTNKPLTKEEALNHPLWLAALNYNKKLLERFVNYVYEEIKKYNKEQAMCFSLKGNNSNYIIAGALRLESSTKLFSVSENPLSFKLARLVGIAEVPH